MDEQELRRKLESIDQAHVLRFLDQLDATGRKQLLAQLGALDLDAMAELAESQVRRKATIPLPQNIQPVIAYPRQPRPDQKQLYADAGRRGRELLGQGKVGAFLVAGGQGTRLGYDGPKGEYPVTPVKNKPLFQVFAEQLLAHSRDAGRPIAWYIMTSDANDAATRAFFEKNNYFGYDAANVIFFQQGMMPAFSMDGKMLLAARDSLALSPDGHGGSLRALHRSGALTDMKERGIEHLSYFQVDNPLVHTIDPLFIGLHDITASEMSSKTIPKAGALEKVGNFVMAEPPGDPSGKPVLQVIEYSDLPESLAKQPDESGNLRFNAGSIAIHVLRASFIERLNKSGRLELPWHRAEKKVTYADEQGNVIKPESANAVKLEQFVFDAIPLGRNAIVYETDRAEEFSPVKNAEGNDSPATSRRDQIRRAARWLEAAGVSVARKDGEPDAKIEISPLLATSAEQLRQRQLPTKEIKSGDVVYLS